jgi:hypothetical protein
MTARPLSRELFIVALLVAPVYAQERAVEHAASLRAQLADLQGDVGTFFRS